MDVESYLAFDTREQKIIVESVNEVKSEKLKGFYYELLATNEFSYIVKLKNKEIPFYDSVDCSEVLNQAIEDLSNSLSRKSVKTFVENLYKIENSEHEFIKEIFIEKVVKNILEIESNKMTPTQLQGSPFHLKTLELGMDLLISNPQHVGKFLLVERKEFLAAIQIINLSNKLPVKNNTEKKNKI